MTREENGQLRLSPAVLATVITTCLAVGSGGAWLASGRPASAGQDDRQAATALTATVEDHRRVDDARDAVTASKVTALESRLDRIEQKIDRLLARKE